MKILFCLMLLSLLSETCYASTQVLVLPKNPSNFSKYVPEGEKPNAITNALDIGHRFVSVDGKLVSVIWSTDIRMLGIRHHTKALQRKRQFVVMFSSHKCKACIPLRPIYEEVASKFKDYMEFGGVDAVAQRPVVDVCQQRSVFGAAHAPCQWFSETFADFSLEYVPSIKIFRPNPLRDVWEVLEYGLARDVETMGNALAELLPGLVQPRELTPVMCLYPQHMFDNLLHPTRPTLIGFGKRFRRPPAFLKSISLDLRDRLVVVHVAPPDTPDALCRQITQRAFNVAEPPALLLVVPRRDFTGKNPSAEVRHARRLISGESWTHGAVRRWLDVAWTELQLGEELNSARLIPRYIDPQVVAALQTAMVDEMNNQAYNDLLDQEADAKDDEADEELLIDFKTEL